MKKRSRNKKKAAATAHSIRQRKRKEEALKESTAASKKAKKGQKGIVNEMKKRGYRLDERTGRWRRLPKPKEAKA